MKTLFYAWQRVVRFIGTFFPSQGISGRNPNLTVVRVEDLLKDAEKKRRFSEYV